MSTPIRRTRSPCCARAASGPTSAVLPRSAMNSRRLMEASPPAETSEQLRLSHRGPRSVHHSKFRGQCLSWVKPRPLAQRPYVSFRQLRT